MTTPASFEVVTHAEPAMGGLLQVAITVEPERRAAAAHAARRAAGRVNAWAARLTRFSDASDLATLNASRSATVAVRPTLAAALHWAEDAQRRSHGVVDATMLDQRLAAESGAAPEPVAGARACAHRRPRQVGRGRTRAWLSLRPRRRRQGLDRRSRRGPPPRLARRRGRRRRRHPVPVRRRGVARRGRRSAPTRTTSRPSRPFVWAATATGRATTAWRPRAPAFIAGRRLTAAGRTTSWTGARAARPSRTWCSQPSPRRAPERRRCWPRPP